MSAESLDLTAKMLKTNPDIYSLWNYRREILKELHNAIGLSDTTSSPIPATSGSSILAPELHLSAECIKKNPKSYGAWHHRKWMISRIECDINSELALCAEFLRADQRNFHCWNYRRFVVSLENVSPQSEFDFAGQKIRENFSNYSAFHHRSVMIQSLDVSHFDRSFVESEFRIVENAVFTEPDDQSAWWYYEFLLQWMQKHLQSNDIVDILLQQKSSMMSLLEIEEKCKWPRLALVSMISLLLQRRDDRIIASDLQCQRGELLARLKEIDGLHVKRYDFMLARTL